MWDTINGKFGRDILNLSKNGNFALTYFTLCALLARVPWNIFWTKYSTASNPINCKVIQDPNHCTRRFVRWRQAGQLGITSMVDRISWDQAFGNFSKTFDFFWLYLPSHAQFSSDFNIFDAISINSHWLEPSYQVMRPVMQFRNIYLQFIVSDPIYMYK